MSYIQINQSQLNDLSFSKQREILLVNRLGAYCSTTVVTCNTRKYHGLLVASQPRIDDQWHVLLSGLDETVFSGDKGYALGIHQYPGVHFPEGQQFMTAFSFDNAAKWTFKMGAITMEKEIFLSLFENKLMIRYHIIEARGQLKFQLRPFIACRNVHAVRQAVQEVDAKADSINNGIRLQLFDAYDALNFQHSRKGNFVLAPDWYHNLEYERENERGYENQESLFQPGFFEFNLRKGDELVFSCSSHEVNPRMLKRDFTKEKNITLPRDNFDNCLRSASEQFIVNYNDGMQVIAGWPWFGRWGRDTFIALPGLTLATNKPDVFKLVMNTMMQDMQDGLFPNTGIGDHASYNSIDAPLWCIWALQQYAYQLNDLEGIWRQYGEKIRIILESYREGTLYNINMRKNYLIGSDDDNYALTWMDAIADGYPVTGRKGLAVEVNALWYNAISFALEAAESTKDNAFISQWRDFPSLIKASFLLTFANETRSYLADHVSNDHTDWSIRPNQIFAISLPFSPVTDELAKGILDTVERELLTPRGLRSLSSSDPAYQGTYFGDQYQRDKGYHQGTVWPWLIGPFLEAFLKVKGADGVEFAESLYKGFEPALFEYGLGTIAEVYNGDPPHAPGGTIAQAWNVAELLRIKQLITLYQSHATREDKKTTVTIKAVKMTQIKN